MSDWQLIGTAPKDESEFLAYDSVSKKQDVAQWHEWGAGRGYFRAVQSDSEYGPYEDEFGHKSENITHWMPLPEPPSEASP